MCKGAYIHYFKINSPIFCCPLFSENYLNTQVRINKMVNKRTIDYHSSLSGLTLIHPLMIRFYRLLRALSLSRIFVKFSLKPVYPTMIRENHQISWTAQSQSSWTVINCQWMYICLTIDEKRSTNIRKIEKIFAKLDSY